jgi:hypothetical protein
MLPPRSQLASSQLSISKTPFGRPSFEVRFFRTAKPSFPAAFSPVHLVVDGGGERDRTVDLLLAKQALSQLSYTPVRNTERRIQNSNFCRSWFCNPADQKLVGQGGFEPPTSRLSSARSNQLSY